MRTRHARSEMMLDKRPRTARAAKKAHKLCAETAAISARTTPRKPFTARQETRRASGRNVRASRAPCASCDGDQRAGAARYLQMEVVIPLEMRLHLVEKRCSYVMVENWVLGKFGGNDEMSGARFAMKIGCFGGALGGLASWHDETSSLCAGLYPCMGVCRTERSVKQIE